MRKRILISLFTLIFALLLSACDFNGPLRNKMVEFFSDDNNYETLTGVVVEKSYSEMYSTELVIKLTSKSQKLPLYTSDSDALFNFHYLGDSKDIQLNDVLTITTSLWSFYNGDSCPIVALEKDGAVLLEFEQGKADYLEWIVTTFD